MKTKTNSKDILEVLQGHGAISDTAVRMLRVYCKLWQASGFDAILATNVLSEVALSALLSESLGIPLFETISVAMLSPASFTAISFQDARRWRCLAVSSSNSDQTDRLRIICADPTNIKMHDFVRQTIAQNCEWGVGPSSKILKAIDEYYPAVQQIFSRDTATEGNCSVRAP